MIRKYTVVCSGILSVIMIILISFSFINGTTCKYTLSINTTERETFLTCYRGKVVALHSNINGDLVSEWKVEARQFIFLDQLIYFVYSREMIVDDRNEGPNDKFNRISSGYRFLFYRYEREGDDIMLMQEFPEQTIIFGKITGRLSYFQK